MNSVVNTVIVWIGNVARVWVELLKANGGKRAVVASVKGYKVDMCGVRGRERKTAGETKWNCETNTYLKHRTTEEIKYEYKKRGIGHAGDGENALRDLVSI